MRVAIPLLALALLVPVASATLPQVLHLQGQGYETWFGAVGTGWIGIDLYIVRDVDGTRGFLHYEAEQGVSGPWVADVPRDDVLDMGQGWDGSWDGGGTMTQLHIEPNGYAEVCQLFCFTHGQAMLREVPATELPWT